MTKVLKSSEFHHHIYVENINDNYQSEYFCEHFFFFYQDCIKKITEYNDNITTYDDDGQKIIEQISTINKTEIYSGGSSTSTITFKNQTTVERSHLVINYRSFNENNTEQNDADKYTNVTNIKNESTDNKEHIKDEAYENYLIQPLATNDNSKDQEQEHKREEKEQDTENYIVEKITEESDAYTSADLKSPEDNVNQNTIESADRTTENAPYLLKHILYLSNLEGDLSNVYNLNTNTVDALRYAKEIHDQEMCISRYSIENLFNLTKEKKNEILENNKNKETSFSFQEFIQRFINLFSHTDIEKQKSQEKTQELYKILCEPTFKSWIESHSPFYDEEIFYRVVQCYEDNRKISEIFEISKILSKCAKEHEVIFYPEQMLHIIKFLEDVAFENSLSLERAAELLCENLTNQYFII